MELKRYIRILLRWWWLALIAFVVVVIGSVVFTYTQLPKYEATTSLVVSPASAVSNLSDIRASLSTLDKPVIANTYAEIAQSRTIIQQAWNDFDVTLERRRRFEIRTSVLYQTNLILITVEGPDPSVAQGMANAIARHTVDYVAGLYEIYDLKLLDAAELPDSPTSPNEKLNLLLGLVVGVGFGVLSAFVAEYLQAPTQIADRLSIVNTDTGAYTQSYFLQRLREEISRSKRNQQPFSITRIQINNLDDITNSYSPEVRGPLLREITRVLKQALHQEDIVAFLGDGEFVVLLPDRDAVTAKRIIERLLTKVQWTPFKIEESGFMVNLTTSAGIAVCHNGTGPDGLLDMAADALQQAGLGDVVIYALSDTSHD